MNTVNFSTPVATINSGNFGQITTQIRGAYTAPGQTSARRRLHPPPYPEAVAALGRSGAPYLPAAGIAELRCSYFGYWAPAVEPLMWNCCPNRGKRSCKSPSPVLIGARYSLFKGPGPFPANIMRPPTSQPRRALPPIACGSLL